MENDSSFAAHFYIHVLPPMPGRSHQSQPEIEATRPHIYKPLEVLQHASDKRLSVQQHPATYLGGASLDDHAAPITPLR